VDGGLGTFRTIEHAYPDRTVQLYFYRCRIISGEPQALSPQEIRVGREELDCIVSRPPTKGGPRTDVKEIKTMKAVVVHYHEIALKARTASSF
jgi:hypothetical protein